MTARILIIEDDEAILKFLRRGLAYEGYQVDTALDGQSGLTLARDNPPDLVVLDLMLPGIDGLEVCRRLQGRRSCAYFNSYCQGYGQRSYPGVRYGR